MFQAFFRKPKPLDPKKLQRSLEVMDRRISSTQPLDVWVFGSVASGEAHEDSDIDMLLVYATDQEIALARDKLYNDLREPLCELPVDLIFVTEDEFLRKSKIGGVCQIATSVGKSLRSLLGDRHESKATL